MKTINVVEIDYDGKMSPVKEYQFEHLPCVDENVILSASDGEPNVYRVLDVHHTSGESTTIYIGFNGTLKSVVRSIANKMS
ncbi:MAG: hypothetical protein RIC35_04210 [Marinoscillum sp.]